MKLRKALYAIIARTWLGGYVYVPLYTLFGPEALHYRPENFGTRVLVRTFEYRGEINEDELDDLEHLVVGDDTAETSFADVRECGTSYEPVETSVSCRVSTI